LRLPSNAKEKREVKRTKRDLATLRRLRANLDVTDPSFAGAQCIRAALSSAAMRLYLESYVLPDLARLGRIEPGPIRGEEVPAMPFSPQGDRDRD
jgi:hypothetical protein